MLSSSDILKELGKTDSLKIEGFDQQYLTPVGYDLRAGDIIFSSKHRKISKLDELKEFKLMPKDTVFISSFESILLPNNIGGFGVSRLGPLLDSVLLTTLPLDPTWNGKLLIILINLGNKPFVIKYKDRLSTLCFFKMDSPTSIEVARTRWNNENIHLKFREMESDAQSKNRKAIIIKFSVVLFLYIVSISLFCVGKIPELYQSLSLGTAIVALYFSIIKRT
jgi:dCTP deaminase